MKDTGYVPKAIPVESHESIRERNIRNTNGNLGTVPRPPRLRAAVVQLYPRLRRRLILRQQNSGRCFSGSQKRAKEMARRGTQMFLKISDAVDLIDQETNLIGIVVERREPKHSRGSDWICSLRIIDDSYPRPGLTVNLFTSTLEELPHVKNLEDMILLTRVKIKTFAGKRVNAVFDKRVSSFALYEEGVDDDFVCYQYSSRFQDKRQYKSSMDDLGRWLTSSKTNRGPTNFSFLREIKEGKFFDLACRVLHVNEDRSVIFVWDGSDAAPTNILATGVEDDAFSSLPLCTLVSRDILLGLPTVGTILRVSAYDHFSCVLKPDQWVTLCGLLCEVDRGTWVGKCMACTKVKRIQDDSLVENIKRLYNKRISSNLGRMPFWSFPWPPGLTGSIAEFFLEERL